MKKVFSQFDFRKSLLSVTALLVAFASFAQDSTVKATTTTNTAETSTTTQWYMNPIAWIIGGIVLLIIIFSLFRNKNTTDKVVVTKTVSRDAE